MTSATEAYKCEIRDVGMSLVGTIERDGGEFTVEVDDKTIILNQEEAEHLYKNVEAQRILHKASGLSSEQIGGIAHALKAMSEG